MTNLNTADLSTIKAALRFYLDKGQDEPSNREDHIHAIATCDGEDISLDREGVTTLSAKIGRLQAGTYACKEGYEIAWDICSKGCKEAFFSYREACESLVQAYKSGEESESIDWADVDEAHRLALAALEKGTQSTKSEAFAEASNQ